MTANETYREFIWPALGLSAFSALAMLGNILVAIAVVKERSLQYVTNYFVLNMATADLMVASLVMPFAIYAQVGIFWPFSTDFF